jgi:serine-type D-Ala-D-Ala carboxypeptidase/endopeptidase (penicillin-binding protein 4)
MIRKLFLKIFIPILVMSTGFQSNAQSDAEKALIRFLGDAILESASIGISFMDISKGESILSHQPNIILIPASTLKLWTTGAALDYLGPEYTFKTEVLYSGYIEDKVLYGDLILKGYGDPTFCSKYVKDNTMDVQFKKIAAWIKGAGIQKVEGKVIIDASFQQVPPEQPLWTWSDLGNYYGGGAWGLNIADNEYEITFKQKNTLGETPEIVKIEPEVPGLTLVNEVRTASENSGDNAYIYGAPYQMQRIIRGSIPAGRGLFIIRGSLPDPALFAGYHLQQYIRNQGVTISGEFNIQRSENQFTGQERILLGKISSPPLSEIIGVINKRSNNSYAESLIRYLGSTKFTGKHLYHGTDAVLDWLEKAGINRGKVFVQDGSGLSRSNGCTAQQLVSSLIYLNNSPHHRAFNSSLAEPGKEGTLKNVFLQLPKGATLQAKSGSLGRVICYSGYLETVSGKKIAFAMLCNNFHGSSSAVRRKMEELVAAIALL